ncbi:MAG: HD domain-containing protein [Candidatus Eiseniibacteriota bacterium]|nr:MAG: HD domain-containing protein [Candidatus Eisenbacteria bacterium]
MEGSVTLEQVKADPTVRAFIEKADEQLGVIGYTEHGDRHANLVSSIASNILKRLGRPDRMAELASIAGYLHDIGNVVNREYHAHSGAIIAFDVLKGLGMDIEEVAEVIAAIGNHHEEQGQSVSDISAAIILADKSDVHRTRVRGTGMIQLDIHDRVNFAAKNSFLRVLEKKKLISLEVTIDTKISQVMEYFEIFLSRMIVSRKAAGFLSCSFELIINGNKML